MFDYNLLPTYSLDEWVNEFHEIYEIVNQERSLSDLWLHTVAHGASIQEDLRTADYAGAFYHLPKAFCWLCAFVRKASMSAPAGFGTNPSLQDIVLNKFPRQCFYCGETRCDCQRAYGAEIQNVEDKLLLKKLRRERAQNKKDELILADGCPRTLQDFALMFKEVFGHKNFDSPIEIITGHLQEEIGEVCEDITQLLEQEKFSDYAKGTGKQPIDNIDLEEELADAFAWIMSTYWKIDFIVGSAHKYFFPDKPQTFGRALAELIWNVYADPNNTHLVDPGSKMRPLRFR